jgi:hypothetical protein
MVRDAVRARLWSSPREQNHGTLKTKQNKAEQRRGELHSLARTASRTMPRSSLGMVRDAVRARLWSSPRLCSALFCFVLSVP